MPSTAVTSRASRDTSARTAPSGPALRRATLNRFCRLWTSTSVNGGLPRSWERGSVGAWSAERRDERRRSRTAPWRHRRRWSPFALRSHAPTLPRPTPPAPLTPGALVVAQADLPDEEPDREADAGDRSRQAR